MHLFHSKWVVVAAGAVGASILKAEPVRKVAGKVLDTLDDMVNSESARQIRRPAKDAGKNPPQAKATKAKTGK